MERVYLLVLFCLLCGGGFVNGQTTSGTPSPAEIKQDIYRKGGPGLVFGESRGTQVRIRARNARRSALTNRDKELTAVDQDDERSFSDFLNARRTGLVRLHDAAGCVESRSVVEVDGTCPWNVPGKAGSYSFREVEYTDGIYSDVQFSDGNLRLVGLNQLGFLTNLGDIAFKDLSLQTVGIKGMVEFMPSANIEAIRSQYALAAGGFQIGDHVYRTSVETEHGKTYALRSIAYRGKIFRSFGSTKVDILKGDKRLDVVIVFRVIRHHPDGSISILWKELSRAEAPRLAG